MLTPNDISNKRFEKSPFGGYKPEEVDSFLSEIAVSYERLYEAKEAAEEKMEVLAEKLEEYRANEDSLRTVLLGAHKLGDNIIRDSKAKAEVIISDAEGQVKQVFSESEGKINKERETLANLQKETAEFKRRLIAMYKQHLELISLMPEAEEKIQSEQPDEEAPVSEEIKTEEAPVQETDSEDDAFFDEVSKAETKRIDLDIQE